MAESRKFSTPLHVGRPNVGDLEAFLRRVRGAFERRWFTNNGELVREFEDKLKEFVGTRHCIPVCNATVGLELVGRALGLQGEVIVPSFTFVATAHALALQGIKPVFCDVDPVTHNLDVNKIERLINRRTSGILAVHVWGRPCQTEKLQAVAERHRLRLVYDAAHAFGCSYRGTMVGNFGNAEVFSFHSTKFFNTFEGGAVATNDDTLAARVRLMKNFGFAGADQVVSLGTNGKMTEISAAMGLTSLECLEAVVQANRRNYLRYRESLGHVPGLRMVEYDPAQRNNFQYIVFEVDKAVAGTTRDEVVAYLHAENVLARRYFFPGCHQMEPYRSLYPEQSRALTETEKLCDRVMSLPNGTTVSEGDVDKVCELIRGFVSARRKAQTSARRGKVRLEVAG